MRTSPLLSQNPVKTESYLGLLSPSPTLSPRTRGHNGDTVTANKELIERSGQSPLFTRSCSSRTVVHSKYCFIGETVLSKEPKAKLSLYNILSLSINLLAVNPLAIHNYKITFGIHLYKLYYFIFSSIITNE